jgi:hypothetical protein
MMGEMLLVSRINQSETSSRPKDGTSMNEWVD